MADSPPPLRVCHLGKFYPPASGGIETHLRCPATSQARLGAAGAAGVGALLMSAFPNLIPPRLRDVLIQTAINLNQPGWDADTGHGVVNAGAAYNLLRSSLPAPAVTEAESETPPRRKRK